MTTSSFSCQNQGRWTHIYVACKLIILIITFYCTRAAYMQEYICGEILKKVATNIKVNRCWYFSKEIIVGTEYTLPDPNVWWTACKKSMKLQISPAAVDELGIFCMEITSQSEEALFEIAWAAVYRSHPWAEVGSFPSLGAGQKYQWKAEVGGHWGRIEIVSRAGKS